MNLWREVILLSILAMLVPPQPIDGRRGAALGHATVSPWQGERLFRYAPNHAAPAPW